MSMVLASGGKRILLTILFAVFLILVAGCGTDPMVSYVEELEKIKLIEVMGEIEADTAVLEREIDYIFSKELEDITHDEIENYRALVDVLSTRTSGMIADVQAVDVTDSDVKEAHQYLIGSLDKFKEALNVFYVIHDAMLDLKEIEAETDLPDLEERVEEILERINQAEKDFDYLINASDEDLAMWLKIVEEGLQ
jgi:hypothetical protein